MEESEHLHSDDTHHLPACCEPKVQVTGDVPVDIIPTVFKCVIDMTEEEREVHFKEIGEEAYKNYLISKERGCFNRCHKKDWCRAERERKEKEKEILYTRNQILEEHARKLEADFIEYKTQSEERFNKLAMLIASLK